MFDDGAGGSPLETLRLAAAYCVGYHEQFRAGDTGTGAYVCHLVLSDPAGFTIQAGGLVTAFVAPAAQEHGVLGVAASATNFVLNESDDSPLEGNEQLAFGVAAASIDPALAAMLGQSIMIERAGGEDGLDLFQEMVKAHLQEIHNTKTGRILLNSLHASGKQTTIEYPLDGLNRALIPKDAASLNKCYYQADGTTPGEGLGLTVNYSPAREFLGGEEEWKTRPPAIGLAHELIHAEQAAYGRMRSGQAINPGAVNPMDATKPATTSIIELETVGVPPHDEYHVTENKIRAEWTPPQSVRPRY